MRKTKQKLFALSLCLALVSLMAICAGCTAIAGASAELSLSPATKTVNIGDNFFVDVLVNTSGKNVVLVAAYLNYDPTELKVLSINTSNSVFTMEIGKTADPTTGEIEITLGKPTPGVNTTRGNVATINFKALDHASPANVTLILTSPRATGDSDIILDDGKGTDVLGIVKNGAYFIVGEKRSPIASFTYSPLNPVIREEITFDASLSTDLGGMIESWEWDFGDKGYGTGVIVTHVYSTVGDYKVILTVTDNDNAKNLTSKTIHVGSPPMYVPDHYPTIQAAVNAASAGDTIIVRDGTYNENAKVNKRLTIRSENGYENCIVQAANSDDHIFEVTADYVCISGFTVEGAIGGIFTHLAGLQLYDADYCNISNNYCYNNGRGISLWDSSSYNNISNNYCSNNDDGIFIWGSNNKLAGNNLVENGIVIEGGSLSNCTHEIDASNTVNGKPVYYLKDIDGGKIPDGAGQVILVNCKNVVVENQNVNNASRGIQIAFSSYITIENNNCSNNMYGINLWDSNNNSISNNNCSHNGVCIFLWFSEHNNISNNNCSNNGIGISLLYSGNNNIWTNNCSNNRCYGLCVRSSNRNSISNNYCSNNECDGIYLYGSNNTLTGNIMVDDGILIEGGSLSNYTHEIDASNTVNGKPVYYWKDIDGGKIPDGAGQVILVNCKNVVVENQNVNNVSIGIQIAFSSYITIENNNCSNNRVTGLSLRNANNNSISNSNCSNNRCDGISLWFSNNNSISNNQCSNNDEGISIWGSDNNSIYLNNFINNADNDRSYWSTNAWISKKKLTYTYNGKLHKNYMGNYWDNYTGTDNNEDGIGDTPYSIELDKDNCPLMKPWQNYF